MRQRVDLGDRHTAVQVRAYVVRLGRRRIVHITSDIAVVVFGLDLTHRHAARIGGDVMPGTVGMHDLVDVFRAQVVLRLAFAVFAVGIDEQDATVVACAILAARLVEHQQTGRDAGAIKQVAWQADHGLQITLVDEVPARFAFLTAAEQYAVRHDGSQAPIGLEHSQHMLHKHQVGLLALLGHPYRETAGKLDVFLDVVLTERRVGQHTVEAPELAVLGLVLRFAQRVLLADDGVRDAMQQHIHLADGPRSAHFFLAEQGQFGGVGPALAQIVARLDQHAA